MTQTSAIKASMPCPLCGLEAWADMTRIYDARNLAQRDGNSYARWAYYVCPADHTTRLPYSEVMVAAGTLEDLLHHFGSF